jgi:hypothetical protein
MVSIRWGSWEGFPSDTWSSGRGYWVLFCPKWWTASFNETDGSLLKTVTNRIISSLLSRCIVSTHLYTHWVYGPSSSRHSIGFPPVAPRLCVYSSPFFSSKTAGLFNFSTIFFFVLFHWIKTFNNFWGPVEDSVHTAKYKDTIRRQWRCLEAPSKGTHTCLHKQDKYNQDRTRKRHHLHTQKERTMKNQFVSARDIHGTAPS